MACQATIKGQSSGTAGSEFENRRAVVFVAGVTVGERVFALGVVGEGLELLIMLKKSNYSQTAILLGVSDNAIRKRLKRRNLLFRLDTLAN